MDELQSAAQAIIDMMYGKNLLNIDDEDEEILYNDIIDILIDN
jgi:hypothetical protein